MKLGEIEDKLTLSEYAPLVAIALILATWGVSYAWRIYHQPMTRTYVSVVIGVGVPLTAITLATAYILWCCSELGDLWGVLFVPWLGVGIPALPMIILQERKHREQLNG